MEEVKRHSVLRNVSSANQSTSSTPIHDGLESASVSSPSLSNARFPSRVTDGNELREGSRKTGDVRLGEGVVSGVVAGLFTKAVCTPFDRIRLLYQVQFMFADVNAEKNPSCSSSTSPPLRRLGHVDASSHAGIRFKYDGLRSTIGKIRREEGIPGLWRGCSMNMVRAAVVYGVKFGTNDYLKQRLKESQWGSTSTQNASRSNSTTSQGSEASLRNLILSGTIAGLVQKTASYPLDFLTVRIALGINTATISRANIQYNGAIDCAARVYRYEGIRGFYKGFGPTLATGVPYVALQMTFFDLFRRVICPDSCEAPNQSLMKTFLKASVPGSCAGVLAQLIVFPGDTVRKRMMSDGCDGRSRLYRNSFDCTKRILAKEGVAAFYHGLVPCVVRAVPSGAIQFGSFETMKGIFRWIDSG